MMTPTPSVDCRWVHIRPGERVRRCNSTIEAGIAFCCVGYLIGNPMTGHRKIAVSDRRPAFSGSSQTDNRSRSPDQMNRDLRT